MQHCQVRYHGILEPAALKTITNTDPQLLVYLLQEVELMSLGNDPIAESVLKIYGVVMLPSTASATQVCVIREILLSNVKRNSARQLSLGAPARCIIHNVTSQYYNCYCQYMICIFIPSSSEIVPKPAWEQQPRAF